MAELGNSTVHGDLVVTGKIIGETPEDTNKQNKTDSTLKTQSKEIVGAINEVFQSASDGKATIAKAITGKGVNTNSNDTYDKMASNISSISTLSSGTSDANAVSSDILSGKTAYVKGSKVTGNMTNRGAVNQLLTQSGQVYTIPQGYHDGNGKITAPTLANLTNDANAVSSDVLSGKTAYVKGNKVTGTRRLGISDFRMARLPFSQDCIYFGANNFFMFEGYSGLYAYSTDGFSWNTNTAPLTALSKNTAKKCGNSEMMLLIDEETGKYIYTKDGYNWYEASLPLSSLMGPDYKVNIYEGWWSRFIR